MTDNTESQTTEEASQPDAVAPQQTELTINDLNALRTLIDLASSRGAYKPAEMVAVGTTYNKLAAFLNFISQAESGKQ